MADCPWLVERTSQLKRSSISVHNFLSDGSSSINRMTGFFNEWEPFGPKGGVGFESVMGSVAISVVPFPVADMILISPPCFLMMD